jgi:hypothetical protein
MDKNIHGLVIYIEKNGNKKGGTPKKIVRFGNKNYNSFILY